MVRSNPETGRATMEQRRLNAPFSANELQRLKLILPEADDREQRILTTALEIVLRQRVTHNPEGQPIPGTEVTAADVRDSIIESRLVRATGTTPARLNVDPDLNGSRAGSLDAELRGLAHMRLGGVVYAAEREIQDAALSAPFIEATLNRLLGLGASERTESGVRSAFRRILFPTPPTTPDGQITAEVGNPASPLSDAHLFDAAAIAQLRTDVTAYITPPPMGLSPMFQAITEDLDSKYVFLTTPRAPVRPTGIIPAVAPGGGPRLSAGPAVPSRTSRINPLTSLDRLAGAPAHPDVVAYFNTFIQQYGRHMFQESLRILLQKEEILPETKIGVERLIALVSSDVGRAATNAGELLAQVPDVVGALEVLRIDLDRAIDIADQTNIEVIADKVMTNAFHLHQTGVLKWTRAPNKGDIVRTLPHAISLAANGFSVEDIITALRAPAVPGGHALPESIRRSERVLHVIADDVHKYVTGHNGRIGAILKAYRTSIGGGTGLDQTRASEPTEKALEDMTDEELEDHLAVLRARLARLQQGGQET